jgi:hypothetical protein
MSVGWSLVAVGAVLAVPQLFMARPWQSLFCVGVVLAIFGAMAIGDERGR